MMSGKRRKLSKLDIVSPWRRTLVRYKEETMSTSLKHDIKNVRQSSVASLHGVLIVDCSVEQSGISLFNTLCMQYSYALFASKIRFLCLPIQDWIYFLRNQTRP